MACTKTRELGGLKPPARPTLAESVVRNLSRAQQGRLVFIPLPLYTHSRKTAGATRQGGAGRTARLLPSEGGSRTVLCTGAAPHLSGAWSAATTTKTCDHQASSSSLQQAGSSGAQGTSHVRRQQSAQSSHKTSDSAFQLAKATCGDGVRENQPNVLALFASCLKQITVRAF